MSKKKQLIFNSDDFGISKAVNEAIYKGFQEGILTSTCLLANGEAFEDAVLNYLPKMPEVGLGVHLNVIEAKTLTDFSRKSMLFDKNGNYNNGFIQLLIKSYNKKFMQEVEFEFRSQIEKILQYAKPDHINSHVHVHAIPRIFELTCKLAQEYDIPYVRTQYERFYFVPDIKKYLSPKFYINIIKLLLLNTFTIINQKTLKKYGRKSCNYFNGVLYTGFMDKNTVKYGILNSLKGKENVTEIIVHPTVDPEKKSNFVEFQTIIDKKLISEVSDMKADLKNYKNFSAIIK